MRTKPLYYAQTPQGCLFASEIKALLHLMSQAAELDCD
jgi:asparagine synthetase B (glutamine-hydrolysing)